MGGTCNTDLRAEKLAMPEAKNCAGYRNEMRLKASPREVAQQG